MQAGCMMMIPLAALLLHLLIVISPVSSQTDAECLAEFKGSVKDPQNSLSSWTSKSGADLCVATGVQCLHVNELKIYSLALPQAGLSGQFPHGLDKCKSLTGLDLSGNEFSGSIPSTLCTMLPFLVTLDLSGNQFSGPIPPELGQCQYLNKLDLHSNQLSGTVPGELGFLSRLNKLDLSGNQLTGQVPDSLRSLPGSGFQNNKGLCGPPVSKDCNGSKTSVGLIAGTAVAGAVVLIAVAAVVFIIKKKPSQKTKGGGGGGGDAWVRKIKSPRSITVSMFEQFLVKIKLSDLMAATDSFSKESVIDSGPTGVSYRATLRDGSVLAVKRLVSSKRSDSQFRSEMETLGHVRHQNLVPLLGFCIAGSERLLIYKHMANGTLWSWLYDVHAGERLDWPARLKIALGTARGLAYLHHTCNPRILHRNISPRTILLDDDFEARITDFGLLRLMSPTSNHMNPDVVGDFGDPGHVAPEYSRIPITTSKGDVFSFGVVLLELLTSQKPVEITIGDFKGGLVEWIGSLYNSGRSSEALDKSLLGRGADEELLQALKVACGCVLFLPKDRPSMYEVFHELRRLGERYDFTDQDDEIVIAANASGGGGETGSGNSAPAAAPAAATTTTSSAGVNGST